MTKLKVPKDDYNDSDYEPVSSVLIDVSNKGAKNNNNFEVEDS